MERDVSTYTILRKRWQNTCRRTDNFSAILSINPLNAELNPIRHLLALVGARHIVHVSRIRLKCLQHALCFGSPTGIILLSITNVVQLSI